MAVILASQSPRRRELLERMGIGPFQIRPAQGEEILDPQLSPAELVETLSRQKAAEIASSDISLSNLVYKDGKFSLVEKSKNALAGIVLEALNNVFATDGSRK